MKRLLLSLTAVFSLFVAASNAHADEKHDGVKISIPGMNCAGCSAGVTEGLKKVKGVTDVTINLKHRVALLQASTKLKDADYKKALKDAGHEVDKIERLKKTYAEAREELEKEEAS